MYDTLVTLVGNVATKPTRREPGSGTLTEFRIASTSRRYDRQHDKWIDGDELFVKVSCWRTLADNVFDSLSVGDPVILRGRLFSRRFTDDNGTARYVYEVNAHAVGHDLSRGVTRFTRRGRTTPGIGGGSRNPEFDAIVSDVESGLAAVSLPAQPDRASRHSATTRSGSSGMTWTGGPSSMPRCASDTRPFTESTSLLTALSDDSLAASAGTSWISRLSARVAGSSPLRPSRRMRLLSHQFSSWSSLWSGRGLPAPGRLSNSPRSWASRICLSIRDSKRSLISACLRRWVRATSLSAAAARNRMDDTGIGLVSCSRAWWRRPVVERSRMRVTRVSLIR
ncbi:single-stranded DNA-binding protein [Stackebrandtia albiflava]|uniref:Single-stranded DNA-binding protein n=1 Tax=Stackebrandtia albiflava TaxID=406432 RepID=A0A562VAK2_9ACTN|nr:single-stranded DNA-binding protein [Stackebrandtia albiflava]